MTTPFYYNRRRHKMNLLDTFLYWNTHFLFFMLMSGGIYYFLTLIVTLLIYSIKKNLVWLSFLPTTILGTILFSYLLNSSREYFTATDVLILAVISAVHAGAIVLVVSIILIVGNKPGKKKGRWQ